MTTQLLEPSPTVTATIHHFKANCSLCRLKNKCFPLSLGGDELRQLNSIIRHEKILEPNQHLFRGGGKFGSLYIVREGALKTYNTTQAGKEHITGFHFPGKLVGLDGIYGDSYASSAVALEAAAVCEIPYFSLLALCANNPGVRRLLFTLLGNEILRNKQLIMLLDKHSAEQRVSAFLHEIFSSFRALKLGARHLRLPMSRIDIANHLGLAVETISRTLSRMEKQGVLQVDNREIAVLNAPALLDMASLEDFRAAADSLETAIRR